MKSEFDRTYEGGNDGNLLYRQRSYVKIGTDYADLYRGIFTVSPASLIEASLLSATGVSTENYSVINSVFTLTLASGIPNTPVYAFMLPLDSRTDDSVSWTKPSETAATKWDNEGGDIEPLSSDIRVEGVWNGSTVSFDITPFTNIWSNSKSNDFSVLVSTDENNTSLLYFYSQESTTPLIGGAALTNCKFLAGGASNTIKTEGIRVKVVPSASLCTISFADTNETAQRYWSSFNASVSVGSTFLFMSPDEEQNLTIGSVTCTVLDKISSDANPTIVVSGLSLGNITEYYTTAEFESTSTLPSGTGIIEIAEPSEKLKYDMSVLNKNDTVYINYTETTTPNNARAYTVNFYSDEIIKNNRVRLYLNESAVTEIRTGLYTEIKTRDVQPKITVAVQPTAFSEKVKNDTTGTKGLKNPPIEV